MTTPALVLCGDALEQLRRLPDESVASIVTDPPYGLSKQPDAIAMLRAWLEFKDHDHGGAGFMGCKWDSFVPGPVIWRECLRVLKPGGWLAAFAHARTVDLMTLAIRIARFEIRDQVQWLYGSGTPKTADRKKIPPGTGTALSPGHEPIVLARKSWKGSIRACVEAGGVGVLAIDDWRTGESKRVPSSTSTTGLHGWGTGSADNSGKDPDVGRWPKNVVFDPEAGALLDEQTGATPGQQGRALQDRRPQGNHVYGARNCFTENPEPRRDSGGPSRYFYCAKTATSEREAGLEGIPCDACGGLAILPALGPCTACEGSGERFPLRTADELTGGRVEGSAGLSNARAGAGRSSKGRRNPHPTVKPLALMRWLVGLTTPFGGLVLDPFCGSGSTGCASAQLGRPFLGIDEAPEHVALAQARIAHWSQRPVEK